MAAAHAQGAGDVPCPDPSVHEKRNKLADQASTAALYVTHPERNPKENVLGKDGKLSASSAAASLKYAKVQDLPSFPSVGIAADSNSAGAAAMLAKDYKMKDLWHPEISEAGSKAALLAARDGGKLELWQPSASKEGNSAATLAMRNKSLSPQLDRGYTQEGRSNALLAATKSQKQSRQPAASTPSSLPALYPDQANSARNALNAAKVSSRNSVRSPPLVTREGPDFNSPAMQAARVHNIGKNVDPKMWGERPPVEIEVQEKKHQEALRASAVSMAKQMYEYQNRTVMGPDPTGTAGAEAAQARSSPSTASADLRQEALRYIHLQEAAQKLAHERLAKVDKNFENAKYREYYGYNMQSGRSRLSVRGRPRARANEDQDVDSDDEEQARRVRGQMSQFSTALADVDAKKQQADRKALLAAAERNVYKSMSSMDDRVFQETGKVSQSKMDEWAAKARAKAQVDSDLRQKNHGKTHIGGGKFMDQSEIEAIALARLKPTLDEISDTAEKKRARDEELRLEREEQERQKRNQKEKEKDEKDEAKKIKNEEKAAIRKDKDERKAAEKEEKNRKSIDEKASRAADLKGSRNSDEPKERKSFLSRLASKRKSRDVKKDTTEAATPVVATAAATEESAAKSFESSAAEPSSAATPVVKDSEEIESSDGVSRNVEFAPGALERIATTHAGQHIDAISSQTLSKKPDLERHVSTIESSDDPSVLNWDAVDESDKYAGLPVITAGDPSAAVSSPDHDEAHAKAVAERVEKKPAVTTDAIAAAAIARPNPVVDEPRQSTASSRPSEEKESKGFRGFFSKLRNKSRTENKLPSEPKVAAMTEQKMASPVANSITTAVATEDAEATGSHGVDSAPVIVHEHVGTDGPIGDSTYVSGIGGNPRSASPSSFRRHGSSNKADFSSLSSTSSSGLDEDDLNEGRTGRMARALGMGREGKRTQAVPPPLEEKTASDVSSPTEESDTFEEARDTFDEGLAPQPAFAGQAKSQSPARETRFKEEV